MSHSELYRSHSGGSMTADIGGKIGRKIRSKIGDFFLCIKRCMFYLHDSAMGVIFDLSINR